VGDRRRRAGRRGPWPGGMRRRSRSYRGRGRRSQPGRGRPPTAAPSRPARAGMLLSSPPRAGADPRREPHPRYRSEHGAGRRRLARRHLCRRLSAMIRSRTPSIAAHAPGLASATWASSSFRPGHGRCSASAPPLANRRVARGVAAGRDGWGRRHRDAAAAGEGDPALRRTRGTPQLLSPLVDLAVEAGTGHPLPLAARRSPRTGWGLGKVNRTAGHPGLIAGGQVVKAAGRVADSPNRTSSSCIPALVTSRSPSSSFTTWARP